MKKIGIISDTHGIVLPNILNFLKDVDAIWHAGDAGNSMVLDELAKFKPLKAVYGNIDGQDVRIGHPEVQSFICEDVKVLMMHIGGYPGRYEQKARQLIQKIQPQLFISGHSHILKVMPDKKYDLLHINPGSAGKSGLHHVITAVRLTIDGSTMKELEVLEIPR